MGFRRNSYLVFNLSKKKVLRGAGVIFIPTIIFAIMRILWFSYRKKYHFIDKLINGQCIAVSWHGELFITPQVYRKLRKKEPTSAIVSKHFHGELMVRVLGFLNILPLRGSSNRGARGALINSIKAIKEKQNILISPDGPKGPRKSMSDGAVALALKARLPIVIINYRPSSYWQLKSWDRFIIPKPFSKLDIYYQVVKVGNMDKQKAKEYLQTVMNKYSI
jgi:lysophospholipid acyltransferase (LPLAT)-like uncharacterized protein